MRTHLQEAEPLAESLCLMLALYAKTELRVQRPKSGFETAQRFVGIEQAARRHVVGSRGLRIRSRPCGRRLCACRPPGTRHDHWSHALDSGRESYVSSITYLRPDIPALLNGENLDFVVAHQDNIPRGFADQSSRDGRDVRN
jgi:hypothetical protein